MTTGDTSSHSDGDPTINPTIGDVAHSPTHVSSTRRYGAVRHADEVSVQGHGARSARPTERRSNAATNGFLTDRVEGRRGRGSGTRHECVVKLA